MYGGASVVEDFQASRVIVSHIDVSNDESIIVPFGRMTNTHDDTLAMTQE
jgi:hypothetical protein